MNFPENIYYLGDGLYYHWLQSMLTVTSQLMSTYHQLHTSFLCHLNPTLFTLSYDLVPFHLQNLHFSQFSFTHHTSKLQDTFQILKYSKLMLTSGLCTTYSHALSLKCYFPSQHILGGVIMRNVLCSESSPILSLSHHQ